MNVAQWAGLPLHTLSVFPCGAFQKKSPANIFAEKESAADGRAQRADPGGFLSFRLVLFLSQKEKERKRTPKRKRKDSEGKALPQRKSRSKRYGAYSGACLLLTIWIFLTSTRKKLVATANRREGVYNRAGEPSVTFCGKGGAAKQTNTPSFRWGIVSGACSDVAHLTGFEPVAYRLGGINRPFCRVIHGIKKSGQSLYYGIF